MSVSIRLLTSARRLPRARLIAQLLTESVLLSLAASLLGLVLAVVGTRAIVALIPKDFPAPSIADVAVDGPVLAFSKGLTQEIKVGERFHGIDPAGFHLFAEQSKVKARLQMVHAGFQNTLAVQTSP